MGFLAGLKLTKPMLYVVLALGVGLILYIPIQYIQEAEKDKVQIEIIKKEDETEEKINETIIEPMVPVQVFFGLIFGIINGPLNKFPIINAEVSFKNDTKITI